MSDAEITVAPTPVETTLTKFINSLKLPFDYDGKPYNTFRAHVHALFSLSLPAGDLIIRDAPDNDFYVHDLLIKWDKFELTFDLDIPTLTVGGFCLIPTPFGCALHAPEITVFDDNPDFSITIPINNIIRSRVALAADLRTDYYRNPARPADMGDVIAAQQGLQSKWQVKLHQKWSHLNLFDVSSIVGDLLERALDALLDDVLGWLPDWAKAAVRWLLGSLIDLIRFILGITDRIEVWISNLLGYGIGLIDLFSQPFLESQADKHPLFTFDDPFQLLGPTPNPNDGVLKLMPILIPVTNPAINIISREVVITSSVGNP